MSLRVALRWGAAAALVLPLGACAAPNQPPAHGASHGAKSERPAIEAQDAATATDTPHAGAPAQPGAEVRDAIRVRAEQVSRAEQELRVAGADCETLCRALRSMDRACGELCVLAAAPPEAATCRNASARLRAARDDVQRACGTCPGVSVERDAPIPSR